MARPDYSNKKWNEVFHDKEHFDLCHSVINNSARSAVVYAAAVLDEQLERILRLKFRSESGAPDVDVDRVLSPEFPKACIVGFASRARVAHLLGLIDESTSASLRLLARIRNEFAHLRSPPQFTESLVQRAVSPMSDDCKSQFKALVDGPMFPLHDPQERSFLAMFMVLHDELNLALHTATA